MKNGTKLNVGCGIKPYNGYINLDLVKLPGVDIVNDIANIPWKPFKKSQFEEVLLFSILEHIPTWMEVLGEAHRVLKPGGRAIIKVPHFTSATSYKDPTHINYFSYGTFDFFVGDKHYYTDWKFSKIKKRLRFGKKFAIWNYLIELIANKFPRVYENTPLRIFPAQTVYVELIK